MLDGVAQIRGSSCVVNDQRDTSAISNSGDGLQVSDISSRVSNTLAEDGTGVFIASRLQSCDVIGVHEGAAPSKALNALTELSDCSTI